MTQQGQPSSRGVLEAGTPHSAGQPAPRSGLPPVLSSWDQLFRDAGPTARSKWMQLAAPEGVVYSHQLESQSNGHCQPKSPSDLDQMLTSDTEELEPLALDVTEAGGTTVLDESQRRAIALVLQTPDIGLIRGGAGTGKSRVVVEAIAQAAQRGCRILLTAPDAAALDGALAGLADRPEVFSLRVLGKSEWPETLSPQSRAATLAQRVRTFHEEAVGRTAAELERLRSEQVQLAGSKEVWDQLDALVEAHHGLFREREQLCDQLSGAAAEAERLAARIRASPDSVPSEFAARLRATDAELKISEEQARSRIEQAQAAGDQRTRDLEHTAVTLSSVRKLHEAKQHGRWWSPRWWRATFQGDVASRLSELEKKLADLRAELLNLDRQMAQAREDLQASAARAAHEDREAITQEAARLQAELNRRVGELDSETGRRQAAWRDLCAKLQPSHLPQKECCREATVTARGLWEKQSASTRQAIADLEEWSKTLADCLPALPQRLLGYVNVVAAPTDALDSPDLGSLVREPSTAAFDLLIVEDAHLLDDAQLSATTRLAERWIFVGEPQTTCQGEVRAAAPAAHGRAPNREPVQSQSNPPALFHRLWQRLCFEPRKPSATWLQENDRICCRLRTVAPEERHWLETETVVDSSEIELRIFSPPRATPELAEVVFPRSTCIAEAKQFILRELQELPLKTQVPGLHWIEKEDRLVLPLTDAQAPDGTMSVTLEPGVRELIYQCGTAASNGIAGAPTRPASRPVFWQTCCLEFDREVGWHGSKARQWLKQVAGLEDLGRTVELTQCHRMVPDLACVVANWIGSALPRPAGTSTAGQAAVEFVPVPPLPRQRPERTARRSDRHRHPEPAPGNTWAPVLPRSGAGLELDLSDPRQRERAPTELRDALPSSGIVNYLEAQSVLRLLTEVLQQSSAQQVAVIALYAAQAQLLRNMLARHPTLSACSTQLRIDVPQMMRHQEFDVVLCSMVRSHSHRAVGYGSGPEGLSLALTRARRQLLLFADPGTIARRIQWEGTVDRLDTSASQREREVLQNIFQYLQGQGACPDRFRIRQSNGA